MRNRVLRLPTLLLLYFFLSHPLYLSALEVYPSHPRLFFRSSAWAPRGLTLQMLKGRISRPEAESVLARLHGSLPNLALKAVLLDNNRAAREAVELLKKPIRMDGTTSDGILVGWAAMAYDWLYHHPEFKENDKKIAAGHITAGARELIRRLGLGGREGGHIFHTRMYGWGMGIALAGLALWGDHPDAETFASYGGRYFKQNLFPARRLQDGSVHNSFGYGRKYTMWLTGHFLSCWHSATGENLWEDIRDNGGDWARKEILFLIYGRYPDSTYVRFGDSYSLESDHYTFRAISERAWAYGDSLGQGFLNLLIEENEREVVERSTAYVYFLFYDPDAPAVSHTTLPTRALFSTKGTGIAIWKSGWEPEGTTVLFKCGNYFGNHGHFDQGHLDIFRRKPLLIDSGAYLTFSGPFRMDYWRKTVAHNTILVVDPAVEGDVGGQRIFHSQSDATIDEYLANEQSETGDIIDYRDEPGLAYVAGDLTAAYPAERVRRVTRELAFLDDRYLLVVDRVSTARAGLVPKVLWHCPLAPEIDRAAKTFELARNGARVLVRTLYPRQAALKWVEGFVAGGKPIPPVGSLKGLDDMGAGRIEVSSKSSGEDHLFIHVIDIADSDVKPGKAEAQVGREEIQVTAGGRKVVFRADAPGLIR